MKTNLVTIIAGKQTKYNKDIINSEKLSEYDLCVQNCLFNSKFNFDNELTKNVILIIFTPEDDLEIIKKIQLDFYTHISFLNHIPIYVLLENMEISCMDVVKMCFAEQGFVPQDWGGDVKFIEEYELEHLLYLEYL